MSVLAGISVARFLFAWITTKKKGRDASDNGREEDLGGGSSAAEIC